MSADTLYPPATQDGKAIPIDIIDPLNCMYVELVNAIKTIVIPDEWEWVYIYASQNTMMQMAEAPTIVKPMVTDSIDEFAAFLPADRTITMRVLPGNMSFSLVGINVGFVAITQIRKWNSLSQPKQTSIG